MKSRKILAMAISSIVATSLVLFSMGLASERTAKEENERHHEKEEGHQLLRPDMCAVQLILFK